MLLDARRDGEHVGVEHDVGRCETDLPDEQVVRATEDLDLPVGGLRLSLLVERHHDDRGAEAAHLTSLGEEVVLTLLQRDRVDDPLALNAAQSGLDHGPARRVDHDREPGNLRLGGDQVQENGHGPLAVEQVGVHVDVEQVGSTAHLLERDVDGLLPVPTLDQPSEARRAGDVRALSDDHERGFVCDGERLEPAEP